MQVLRGLFYEFHSKPVISRPGQPIACAVGVGIGRQISKEEGLQQVRGGRNVYIRNKEDSCKLASQLYDGRPEQEPADSISTCAGGQSSVPE